MFTCELPSGIKVSVEAPTYFHRTESVKEFRVMKDEVGYSVEELMAAKSITAINGQVVQSSLMLDPIYIMSEWPNSDVQYYLEWYMTLFFLEDKIKDRATNEAKKIMMGVQTEKLKTTPVKVAA